MAQQIKIIYRNILENSTVTVTTENASFPKYRLYDRDIGKLFKGTAFASPFAIVLDQGATISYEMDRLLIPVGHNFNGLACKLQYSTTGAWGGEEVDALSWTQGDALLIDKTFTAATKRYWRLIVTAPATIVELPEMFLGPSVILTHDPDYGLLDGLRDNIHREEARSGLVFKAELGEMRKYRKYQLEQMPSAQKDDLQSFRSWIRGTLKPFYVDDLEGNVFFAELLNPMDFIMEWVNRFGAVIELLEVLGRTN